METHCGFIVPARLQGELYSQLLLESNVLSPEISTASFMPPDPAAVFLATCISSGSLSSQSDSFSQHCSSLVREFSTSIFTENRVCFSYAALPASAIFRSPSRQLGGATGSRCRCAAPEAHDADWLCHSGSHGFDEGRQEHLAPCHDRSGVLPSHCRTSDCHLAADPA